MNQETKQSCTEPINYKEGIEDFSGDKNMFDEMLKISVAGDRDRWQAFFQALMSSNYDDLYRAAYTINTHALYNRSDDLEKLVRKIRDLTKQFLPRFVRNPKVPTKEDYLNILEKSLEAIKEGKQVRIYIGKLLNLSMETDDFELYEKVIQKYLGKDEISSEKMEYCNCNIF